MKLFQSYLSPFPTRVRLVLYAKGLDVSIIEPSGFHGSPDSKGDYMDVNPIGRIPALQLDDGRVLPESEVICEYLEDAYPEPPLRPADPMDRARVRLLARICDIYMIMAMVPLFDSVDKPRAQWDPHVIDKAVAGIEDALKFLEEYIGDQGYAVGNSLTHADGALVPILLLVHDWLPIFGKRDLLRGHAKVFAYWEAIQDDPIAARVLDETRSALSARRPETDNG